ncbi:MAG: XamI family restriction endonuclease [Anaerolineae bacterium]|nr:XamI family restriction endonuclease [Anaerolineae bacterium]
MLRMATAPPIARDRLIGLAQVTPSLVRSMELKERLPPRMDDAQTEAELEKICRLIMRLADVDIFPWLQSGASPNESEVYRAATIVADRLCGAMADPVIRNAQEQRQLATIQVWLERRSYAPVTVSAFDEMQPGTFTFRLNAPVTQEGRARQVNLPIDVVVMPKRAISGEIPLLLEAKSAGDFTNVNKRRKEEAVKIAQLRSTYGSGVRFVLFLCGYFDSGYLGYEAAEGIDWVWEHRTDDLAEFGL